MSRVVNLFDVCRDNWVCKLNTNKNCFVFPVPTTRHSHVIKVCGAWISCSKLLLFPEEINWNHTKWEMSWWRGSCWRRGCLKHKLFFSGSAHDKNLFIHAFASDDVLRHSALWNLKLLLVLLMHTTKSCRLIEVIKLSSLSTIPIIMWKILGANRQEPLKKLFSFSPPPQNLRKIILQV